MNHKLLPLAAICVTMMACNKTEISNRIELPGTVDIEAFAANVESISVENLQMEDNWAFMELMAISLSDNYLYMIENTKLQLTCFDRKTGEKLSDRTIMGNGPGEIVEMKSLFCIGDTLCIYDEKGNILQYDNNCKYVGKKHEFSNISWRYNLTRLDNGNYAFVSITNPDADDSNPAMMLADKDFNIISKHFDVPQAQISIINGIDGYYVVGDTIHAIFLYGCKLYTLNGDTEQVTDLVVPNPITPEKANELFISDDFTTLYNYDGSFFVNGGSGRFLMFSYHIGDDQYITMDDYHTNKATSILVSNVVDNIESTAGIVCNLLFKATPVKSADGYFYLKIKNSDLAYLLEDHDNLLDSRLKATQASYHTYLERNAEYIKGLDENERNEANVMIKIKLKN